MCRRRHDLRHGLVAGDGLGIQVNHQRRLPCQLAGEIHTHVTAPLPQCTTTHGFVMMLMALAVLMAVVPMMDAAQTHPNVVSLTQAERMVGSRLLIRRRALHWHGVRWVTLACLTLTQACRMWPHTLVCPTALGLECSASL